MGAYYTWGRIIHGGVLYMGAYYTWGRIIHGGVLYMGAYYTRKLTVAKIITRIIKNRYNIANVADK